MHLPALCPRVMPLSSAAFARRAETHSEFANESMFAGTVAALWKLRLHCRLQERLRRFVPAGGDALDPSIRVTAAASGDFVKCCRLVTRPRWSRWPKGILRSMRLRDARNIPG